MQQPRHSSTNVAAFIGDESHFPVAFQRVISAARAFAAKHLKPFFCSYGKRPLEAAASAGHSHVVQLLVDAGTGTQPSNVLDVQTCSVRAL